MQFLVSQQDYAWFLAALAWSWAVLLWWQFERNTTGWQWLPWSAAAGLATAAIEVFTQVTAPSSNHAIGLHPLGDFLLGAVAAVHVMAWAWIGVRRSVARTTKAGLGGLAVAVAAAAVERWWCFERTIAFALGTALILAAFATAVVMLRAAGRAKLQQWALCSVAAATALGSWGPIAVVAQVSRRWSELNPFGFVSASAQAIAAVVACFALLHGENSPLTRLAPSRAELRWFSSAIAAWLLGGMALAWWSARTARQAFVESLTAQAMLASELLDRRELKAALGSGVMIDEMRTAGHPTQGTMLYPFSRGLSTAHLEPIQLQLAEIKRAVPRVGQAFVVTIGGGKILGCVFAPSKWAVPGDMSIERNVTSEDQRAWENRSIRFNGLVSSVYGDAVSVWAPLATDQKMLGWLALEYGANEWLASQAQARWQMFAIIGFGALASVLLFLNRLRERERTAIRQQAEAAAALNMQKSAFLAKVSHELRTPLQTILGYSEWLDQSVTSNEDQTHVRSLRKHASLMLRLVNDLLDLSAVEAGSFRMAAKPFLPADVVQSVVAGIRPRAEAKQLRLAVDCDRAVTTCVQGDADRFSQIVLNLAGNAVKFTDAGEVHVTLEAHPASPQHQDLVLTVKDTGPGIAQENVQTLFQPFARLEKTSSKQGAGLGLSLAAALCRSMRGTLTVETSFGRGATFTARLRLPCADMPVNCTVPSVNVRGRSVLLAEDHELVRELYSSYISRCGAECTVAIDGVEALALAETGRFDVIVMDLSLPKLDGFEVTRRLRSGVRRQPLRIIGVSAHASPADREQALAVGMDIFLAKPCSLDELVREIAGGPSSVRPDAAPDLERLMDGLRNQFRLELPPHAAQLNQAQDDGDWDRVCELAHYVANGAAVIQDHRLHDACSRLQQAATSRNAANAHAARIDFIAAAQPWVQPLQSSDLHGRATSQLNQIESHD